MMPTYDARTGMWCGCFGCAPGDARGPFEGAFPVKGVPMESFGPSLHGLGEAPAGVVFDGGFKALFGAVGGGAVGVAITAAVMSIKRIRADEVFHNMVLGAGIGALVGTVIAGGVSAREQYDKGYKAGGGA